MSCTTQKVEKLYKLLPRNFLRSSLRTHNILNPLTKITQAVAPGAGNSQKYLTMEHQKNRNVC